MLVRQYNNQNFKINKPCYIQYAFKQPFTCRSIKIKSKGYNYQANRLVVETSNDGIHFQQLTRLVPPRTGWEDSSSVTHSVPATTAKYFRFVYNNEGSEPGAEDIDAAKWKQSLSVKEITLSSEPSIYQYESKNGEVWRISKSGNEHQLPDSVCVPLHSIINITAHVDKNGRLKWNTPEGKWVILRIGHTSTGSTNATAGGGKGLECDKFDTAVAALQFRSWFGETIQQAGPGLAKKVLSIFHVDSWECGSQNWSHAFPAEFKRRRGYDLMDYLPAMAGIPVENNEVSERFLHDIRQTIAQLIVDNFYGTMAELAHSAGCTFSGESVAPTMMSDGMLHYKKVDLPMGEFWYNSPTHDKPNDMLDAISGAHIYNKQIVQAEAFTTLRMDWTESPATLKATGDRAYAMGINRFVYHVYTHNPFTDRKPGMTLNGVGQLFQRDQTWWKPGKAWIEYAQRCQALLQTGKPVVDIAVFAGEDVPVRAVLPDRLMKVLPGIFGKERIEAETKRLANKNSPIKEQPMGVYASANIANPKDWADALRGYKYDSFNKDAFLHTIVKDGKVVFENGNAYSVLVFPGSMKMNPNGGSMSLEVVRHLDTLLQQGATIILPPDAPAKTFNLNIDKDKQLHALIQSVYQQQNKKRFIAPWQQDDFVSTGIQRDVEIHDDKNASMTDFAWTHRRDNDVDIYFISNQKEEERSISISLRTKGKVPEIWSAVTGSINKNLTWKFTNGRTNISLDAAPNQSFFIVLAKPAGTITSNNKIAYQSKKLFDLNKNWKVQFDTGFGGPEQEIQFDSLTSWTKSLDSSIKYYSGTASYHQNFILPSLDTNQNSYYIRLAGVHDLAEVIINGKSCRITCTYPYQLDISNALYKGNNDIIIKVTNTWHNRLIYDNSLPKQQRITWTNAPFRLQGWPLTPSGITGNISIFIESKNSDLRANSK
ncbi:DNA-binding protein [Ilyomonas limi]|uniref:DNA-binding protein n=1 Tax=Ilyomonas limi TaxID=2575867 RepID=A0A4U3KTP4_9BACT|nr:glycosyl hydrolase [Ilyomonas limi]TKK65798.1 DNA-binding protein [Ilyomonas limi]